MCMKSMKRIMFINNSNIHEMFKVNFLFKVSLDACVSLSGIKTNISIKNILVELMLNICNIKVSFHVHIMGNFIDLFTCKLNSEEHFVLFLIFLSATTFVILRHLLNNNIIVRILLQIKVIKLIFNNLWLLAPTVLISRNNQVIRFKRFNHQFLNIFRMFNNFLVYNKWLLMLHFK